MIDWHETGARLADFDWVESRTLGGKTSYHRGRCHHARVVPVELLLTGEVVAQLCLSCDAQLPAEWTSPFAAPTIAELNVGVA